MPFIEAERILVGSGGSIFTKKSMRIWSFFLVKVIPKIRTDHTIAHLANSSDQGGGELNTYLDTIWKRTRTNIAR